MNFWPIIPTLKKNHSIVHMNLMNYTPPKTNIELENAGVGSDDFPKFQGAGSGIFSFQPLIFRGVSYIYSWVF